MAKATEVVNPEPKIEGELPEPQISGSPAGQSLEQAGDSSVTLEAIEKLVEKQFQSMKDTRLGKFDTRLDDLEGAVGRYEALQAQGLSKDQALNQMQGDKELGDIKTQLASLLEGKVPDVSAGVGTQSWKERRASILSDAKIEGSDPRFVEFMKQKFTSHDDMNEKLFEIAEGWSFADEIKPQPSASTVAQIVPSIPSADVDVTEKYKEDMYAARGNARLGKQIKESAKKAGVDVDNIGFGDRVTP
jgi:hypothetical protein